MLSFLSADQSKTFVARASGEQSCDYIHPLRQSISGLIVLEYVIFYKILFNILHIIYVIYRLKSYAKIYSQMHKNCIDVDLLTIKFPQQERLRAILLSLSLELCCPLPESHGIFLFNCVYIPMFPANIYFSYTTSLFRK